MGKKIIICLITMLLLSGCIAISAFANSEQTTVSVTQENFLDLIKDSSGKTLELTENIILNDDNIDFDGNIAQLSWSVEEMTTVLMGDYSIRLEGENRSNRVEIKGPFHFIGQGNMFETENMMAELLFQDVLFTLEGENSIGLYSGKDSFISFCDCTIEIKGNSSVGAAASPRGGLIIDSLEIDVSGESATGILYEAGGCSGQYFFEEDKSITGVVSGLESVGVLVEGNLCETDLRVYLTVCDGATGLLVRSGGVLRPAGNICVLTGGTGVFVEDGGELNFSRSSSLDWFFWETDNLNLEVKNGATGVLSDGDISLLFMNFNLEDSAAAVKAKGDLKIVASIVTGGNEDSIYAGGEIVFDSCFAENVLSSAKLVQRKACPQFYVDSRCKFGEFEIMGGYNLDWYGFFLPVGSDLEEEDMPKSLGFTLYDPEDPSAEVFRIVLPVKDGWDIKDIDVDTPNTYELKYSFDFAKDLKIEGINEGEIDFHIYGKDRPFIAYAQGMGRYDALYYTPFWDGYEDEELELHISEDEGETWTDISEDDEVVIYDGRVLIFAGRLEKKNYAFRIKAASGNEAMSNVLYFNPDLSEVSRDLGGDRDGGDQSGQGPLPGGEVEPDPKPSPEPNPAPTPGGNAGNNAGQQGSSTSPLENLTKVPENRKPEPAEDKEDTVLSKTDDDADEQGVAPVKVPVLDSGEGESTQKQIPIGAIITVAMLILAAVGAVFFIQLQKKRS